MVDEVFADVPSEGAKLEIDQALDRLSAKDEQTASASQPGKKETATPSKEGANIPPEEKTPFHKHPRWIQTQKELKELREETARLKAQGTQTQPTEPPDWWKKQYGDTDESKQRYQQVVQKDGELDWIKNQVLETINSQQAAEQTQITDGETYVNTQLAEMSDEGLKFEKNALLKFMVDFQEEFGAGSLLDTEGNYDFRKALNLMSKVNPTVTEPNVRKQLPTARGKVNAQRPTGIPVLSRNTLRRGNWRDADTGQFTSN